MSVFPKQKLSKTEKGDDWKKSNITYFINNTNFYNSNNWEFFNLYKAAQGELDKSAYKYVLNPYNSKDENLKNYPAQMRNYDIISPIINLFMGEKADKPSNMEIVCVNSDSSNKFEEGLHEQMLALMAQDFINKANNAGIETGVDSQEIPPYEKAAAEYKESWKDERAIFGQEALDYIRYNCDLKDKYQDAFYDWVVTGRCYSFKEVRDNDVHVEIVPPYEISHGTSTTNFVEDCNWVVRRFRLTPNDIVDRFRHFLLGEDIDFLEDKANFSISESSIYTTANIDTTRKEAISGYFNSQSGLLDVYHCVWKSFKKVGILTYFDELGQEQMMEVEEGYILEKEHGDIKIEWEFINEVWEGYRVGSEGDLYFKIQPFEVQRDNLNNSSIVKLPYNGRIGYAKNNEYMSVVKTLIPYQALYNIYHYRGELTLARNKDKLMLMPMGLLPKGWEIDKALYFAETTGLMWFDETKANAANILNSIRGIDLGLGNYVEQMRALLSSIKEEAWDNIGMNRQRYGDSKASDGKGVSEQAVFRSSTITREMFRKFEKFEESDAQGLLDNSKYAWIEGKAGAYITSDGRQAFFKTNGIDHLESNYSVFAKDSSEEQAKLQQAKQITGMMAQKGSVSASLIFESIDSNNFSKLKKIARQFEDIETQLVKQQQESEQENGQILQDKINANDAANRDIKLQTEQIKSETAITVAKIQANANLTSKQLDIENQPEEVEEKDNSLISDLLKDKNEKSKLDLDASKFNQQNLLKEKDQQIKLKEIKSKEEISKRNKN